MRLVAECFGNLSSLCLRLLLACVGRRVSPFALHPPPVRGDCSRRLWIRIGTWCALEHTRRSYSWHRRNRHGRHLVCHRGSCSARHCGQREVYSGALLVVKTRTKGYLFILGQSKVGTNSLGRVRSDGGLLLTRMKTHLDSYSDKLELARNLQQTRRSHELALACLQRPASSTVKPIL
jgi:hypothetical protein